MATAANPSSDEVTLARGGYEHELTLRGACKTFKRPVPTIDDASVRGVGEAVAPASA